MLGNEHEHRRRQSMALVRSKLTHAAIQRHAYSRQARNARRHRSCGFRRDASARVRNATDRRPPAAADGPACAPTEIRHRAHTGRRPAYGPAGPPMRRRPRCEVGVGDRRGGGQVAGSCLQKLFTRCSGDSFAQLRLNGRRTSGNSEASSAEVSLDVPQSGRSRPAAFDQSGPNTVAG